MKTKFLLFCALCACFLSMLASEEPNCGQTDQTDLPALEVDEGAAIDGYELYQQMAVSFALVDHARCGVRSPFYGLPRGSVQQICTYLRQLIKHCPVCNFTTFDRDKFEAHKGPCLSEFKKLLKFLNPPIDFLNPPTIYPVFQWWR